MQYLHNLTLESKLPCKSNSAQGLAMFHLTQLQDETTNHEKKPNEQWENTVWSDETKIHLFDLCGTNIFGINLTRTLNACSWQRGKEVEVWLNLSKI